MMTGIGILLSFVGLGVVAALVFTLAVYALPFFIGLTVGLAANDAGMGTALSIVLGFVTAGFALALGRFLLARLRAPILRISVSLVYAVPAALAGYSLSYALSDLGSPADTWRQIFAVIGAAIIGATAWVRVAAERPQTPARHEPQFG